MKTIKQMYADYIVDYCSTNSDIITFKAKNDKKIVTGHILSDKSIYIDTSELLSGLTIEETALINSIRNFVNNKLTFFEKWLVNKEV